MEDKSPFNVGTKNWAPAHGPNSTVKTSYLARRSQLLRARAPPRERFDSHLSLLILEERWANLAQLFTFYWDLTRNKFSFPLNAVAIRSVLLIRFPRGTPFWNPGNLDGDRLEHRPSLRTINKMNGRIASPRAEVHSPYHLPSRKWYLGALQKLLVISNVKIKGQWIRFWELILAPPHPTLLRHSGRIWSALSPPIDANANDQYRVLKCYVQLV